MVAADSLDTKVGNSGPTEDTGYFVEVIDYFFGDTEVVAGRLGYTVAANWANYCSNYVVERKNLGEYFLATNYYYNQNYSEGLEAYLVSEPMAIFEKHKSLLLYPHQLL